ncbi:MAG: M15 family metallopeptidase, partial [Armatimonadetes bacterium]|nr:M15 family metallopeptidase [Armatimonadota bacterium]
YDLPILGKRSCHRLVGPQLQRILGAIAHDGLADHLRLDDFGGIFAARRMRGGTSWSHHAWGVAIDLNVHEGADGNPGEGTNFQMRGEFPHLRRLVPYFVAENWAAGIQWQRVPDPMHFEARSAHGTGLLAGGTLKGIDWEELDGLTALDLRYLKSYPEYQPAAAPLARKLVLPNGESVTYELQDGRAVILAADLAEAMGWALDVKAWPVLQCRAPSAAEVS